MTEQQPEKKPEMKAPIVQEIPSMQGNQLIEHTFVGEPAFIDKLEVDMPKRYNAGILVYKRIADKAISFACGNGGVLFALLNNAITEYQKKAEPEPIKEEKKDEQK